MPASPAPQPAFAPAPQPTSASPLDRVPRFTGAIGHLEKARAFTDFVHQHEFKIIFVDVWIGSDEFQGQVGPKETWITLFDNCPNGLAPGEKPQVVKCTGTSFFIDQNPAADASLYCTRGVCKMRGYFAVGGFDGPHQGLMGGRLRPLRAEDVR